MQRVADPVFVSVCVKSNLAVRGRVVSCVAVVFVSQFCRVCFWFVRLLPVRCFEFRVCHLRVAFVCRLLFSAERLQAEAVLNHCMRAEMKGRHHSCNDSPTLCGRSRLCTVVRLSGGVGIIESIYYSMHASVQLYVCVFVLCCVVYERELQWIVVHVCTSVICQLEESGSHRFLSYSFLSLSFILSYNSILAFLILIGYEH